jgi:hypothetical protein
MRKVQATKEDTVNQAGVEGKRSFLPGEACRKAGKPANRVVRCDWDGRSQQSQ